MIQKMIVPETVVQVGDVVPDKHQNHAEQKLFISKWQGENIQKSNFFCFWCWIFLGKCLHQNINENQNKGEVTESKNQLVLQRRAFHGIDEDTTEQEHGAGQNRREGLIQNNIASPLAAVLRIETVEPCCETWTEQSVYCVGEEQQNDEPCQTIIGVAHKLRHQCRGNDVHRIEVNLRSQKNSLFLLEAIKNRR